MPLVAMNCGRLSKKAEALSSRRRRCRWLLDWHQFGKTEGTDNEVPESASIPTSSQSELIVSTAGKTACREWDTDGWGGDERVFTSEVEHYISKALRQLNERTNGIVRQQTGRWHRRQNKFGKLWEQTQVTVRLVISYFNWIWQHSELKTTSAACRINRYSLALGWFGYLSHTSLGHDQQDTPLQFTNSLLLNNSWKISDELGTLVYKGSNPLLYPL